MILNSVPAAMVPHSEDSSTVLSWLQTADAAGALLPSICEKGIGVNNPCRLAPDYSEENACYYFLN